MSHSKLPVSVALVESTVKLVAVGYADKKRDTD